METLTLTTPLPAASDFTVDELFVSRSKQVIAVDLVSANGRTLSHRWNGAIASTRIVALNKANLSTAGNSLNRRILDFLIADGVLSGSVSGSAD